MNPLLRVASYVQLTKEVVICCLWMPEYAIAICSNTKIAEYQTYHGACDSSL